MIFSRKNKPPEAPSGPTFAKFAETFLEEHPGRRRSDHYPDTVKRLVAHFGDRPLRQITRAELDRFRVELLSSKARCRSGVLSPTTVVKILRTLGFMFKIAVRWGVLEVNPAADLEKPPVAKSKTRYLTADDLTKLDEAAPPWLRPILTLAVSSGMRLKEITALRRDDVDQGKGFLYVAQDTKTGTRVVPLTKAATAVLKGQVRHLPIPVRVRGCLRP